MDLNRVARKLRKKRADAAKQAAFAAKVPVNPFSPTVGNHTPVSLWDLQRLRAGYSRGGFNPNEARLYLQVIQRYADEHGVRPGKFEFRRGRHGPHPDEMKIILTGKHMPEVFQRVARWSAERHELLPPDGSG